MKRLKTTLAKVLLISAGAAAIGLGTVMAVAALMIGLVVAAAAKLAMGSQDQAPSPDQVKPNDTVIVEGDLAATS